MDRKCNQQIWKNEQELSWKNLLGNKSSSLMTKKTYKYNCIRLTSNKNIPIDEEYIGVLNFHRMNILILRSLNINQKKKSTWNNIQKLHFLPEEKFPNISSNIDISTKPRRK